MTSKIIIAPDRSRYRPYGSYRSYRSSTVDPVSAIVVKCCARSAYRVQIQPWKVLIYCSRSCRSYDVVRCRVRSVYRERRSNPEHICSRRSCRSHGSQPGTRARPCRCSLKYLKNHQVKIDNLCDVWIFPRKPFSPCVHPP